MLFRTHPFTPQLVHVELVSRVSSLPLFSGLVYFFYVTGWRHLCLSNKRVISTSSNGYIVSAFHTFIPVRIPRLVSRIQCCTECNATLKHLVAIWRNFPCKCASAFCAKSSDEEFTQSSNCWKVFGDLSKSSRIPSWWKSSVKVVRSRLNMFLIGGLHYLAK